MEKEGDSRKGAGLAEVRHEVAELCRLLGVADIPHGESSAATDHDAGESRDRALAETLHAAVTAARMQQSSRPLPEDAVSGAVPPWDVLLLRLSTFLENLSPRCAPAATSPSVSGTVAARVAGYVFKQRQFLLADLGPVPEEDALLASRVAALRLVQRLADARGHSTASPVALVLQERYYTEIERSFVASVQRTRLLRCLVLRCRVFLHYVLTVARPLLQRIQEEVAPLRVSALGSVRYVQRSFSTNSAALQTASLSMEDLLRRQAGLVAWLWRQVATELRLMNQATDARWQSVQMDSSPIACQLEDGTDGCGSSTMAARLSHRAWNGREEDGEFLTHFLPVATDVELLCAFSPLQDVGQVDKQQIVHRLEELLPFFASDSMPASMSVVGRQQLWTIASAGSAIAATAFVSRPITATPCLRAVGMERVCAAADAAFVRCCFWREGIYECRWELPVLAFLFSAEPVAFAEWTRKANLAWLVLSQAWPDRAAVEAGRLPHVAEKRLLAAVLKESMNRWDAEAKRSHNLTGNLYLSVNHLFHLLEIQPSGFGRHHLESFLMEVWRGDWIDELAAARGRAR